MAMLRRTGEDDRVLRESYYDSLLAGFEDAVAYIESDDSQGR